MEVIRPGTLAFLAIALFGCAKAPVTAASGPKDPSAGLSGEAKIDAIRNDRNLLSAEKATKIVEAQKAAGLPVTGQ